MHDGTGLSRRRFLTTAGAATAAAVAGGTLLLTTNMGGLAGHAATWRVASDMTERTDGAAAQVPEDVSGSGADRLLQGVSDIHLHAAPDSRGRSINELDFARAAKAAGYRAVMFKSNDFSCHDRAYVIRQAVPDFECFGSLCMNRVHGDRVNVAAAEAALKTTGQYCRCIWMPTQDAAFQVKTHRLPGPGIPVLNESGTVLPEVVRVMELCAEAKCIFATGHSSPEESLVLAKKARDVGVEKFVVTHANSLIWKMTHDQIQRAVDLGAYVEFCYLNCLWGPGTGLPRFVRQSHEEFRAFISIAPERSFISTDLGQVGLPHPLDGMRACIHALRQGGIAQKHLDLLLKSNPALLLGMG